MITRDILNNCLLVISGHHFGVKTLPDIKGILFKIILTNCFLEFYAALIAGLEGFAPCCLSFL